MRYFWTAPRTHKWRKLYVMVLCSESSKPELRGKVNDGTTGTMITQI